MKVNKKDVIQLLETIALYLELKQANSFRIAAYRKAAQGLEKDVRSLAEIDDFTTVASVGQGTNDLIVEYVETGKSTTLASLQEEIPAGLLPLLKLPGLGGKRLGVLYQTLQITGARSLYAACIDGSVEQVKGFGKKTVENIINGLNNMNNQPERLPVHYMLEVAEEIDTYLASIDEIIRYSLAGSLRRLKEKVKDIDFIIATADSAKVREKLLAIPKIKEVIASGETKVSIVLEDEYDVQVDFRLIEDEAFSTTLHHFTGSKEHNVRMRQLAKTRGEKISEYGVKVEATKTLLQFKSEEAFFNHFGLPFIPPEMREDMGEIEQIKQLETLVDHKHIRGDFHMHTTWSDGAYSIEDMVNAARKLQYEYIAITDHSKFLKIANGLNETRLRNQKAEIDRLNEKYDDIHIFAGVEMDILPNGTLDFSDDFLQEMDIVIAAIHSGFDQTEEEIMQRLFTALENPYVDIVAHPTGRIIGRRDGYLVNMEGLIAKAKETNTVLELNANPMRFDLKTSHLQAAQNAGVPIAINTDAHHIEMLNHMDYGVKMGKKAWLQQDTVMNTWSKERVMAFLNRNK